MKWTAIAACLLVVACAEPVSFPAPLDNVNGFVIVNSKSSTSEKITIVRAEHVAEVKRLLGKVSAARMELDTNFAFAGNTIRAKTNTEEVWSVYLIDMPPDHIELRFNGTTKAYYAPDLWQFIKKEYPEAGLR